MDQRKPTKLEKSLPIIFGIIVLTLIIAVLIPTDEQKTKDDNKEIISIKNNEWVLEKDIDINTGDTIYKSSLFTDMAPALSFYRETNMMFCIDKTGDTYNLSLILGKGHFLPNKKVDFYFLSMKPDMSYEYDVSDDGKCAKLKVKNAKALIKKIQNGTGFFVHVYIDKQTGDTAFGFMYDQESAKVIKL